MATKQVISSILVTMGFESKYIERAFRFYKKKYGDSYNVKKVKEVIVRLMAKDEGKSEVDLAFEEIILDKLHWSCTKYMLKNISFYQCIATEIYGNESHYNKLKKEIWRYMASSYTKDADFSFAAARMDIDDDTLRLCLIAASELYNVRIVLFEFETYTMNILPRFKCYVDRKNIPIILLARTGHRRSVGYYIIRDLNDIAFAAPPTDNFDSYVDCLNKMQPEITQISAYCNYLMIQTFGYSQGLPMDIYELIKRFMPKMNLRPIGKREAFENEQMILLREKEAL